MGGPSRRDIGHGTLAMRGLSAVLPSEEDFPYSIRVVSEVLESNGSSSMATVCGGSMAMMDAGIPIKKPVSGIAMGLIKEGDKVIILSDILGDEDHLGDMDFQVVGTDDGVTSLQMDIKIGGVDRDIMGRALAQAKEKAETLANVVGVKLGKVISFSESTNQPVPIYANYSMAKDLNMGGGVAAPAVA